MERISYLGKQIYPKQKRNKRGEYARKGLPVMPIISGALIVGFGVFLAMNSGITVEYQATPVAQAAVISTSTPVAAPVSLEERVEKVKHDLVEQMAHCENKDHILTWPDDSHEHSLPLKDKVSNGDLAFKISTVERFNKILHGTTLSDRDALELALDPVRARELALDAWINIKGSINEWSCATDDMRAKVEVIRELEK
jgi:hypothetical protein